jgi:hypothetical protein
MSMPHDNSDNRGDSDVELVGGGVKGILAGFTRYLL